MSMWIDKNKSNETKTVYVMDYADALTNKRRYASITLKGKATKRQYNEALNKLQHKVAKKIDRPLHVQNRTFQSMSVEWLEQYQHTVKYTTYKNTAFFIKRLNALIDNDIQINKLHAQFIQKLINDEYYKRNMSYTYIAKLKTTIKQILKYAKKCGYVEDINYMQDVEIKKKPKTKEELHSINNKFLDKTELSIVLKQMYRDNPRYAMLCEFMALTGARFGEAVAIRVQDIDLENRTLSINGTIALASADGGCERTTPKNETSYRTINLNNRCIDILRSLMLDNKKARLLHRGYRDQGYIFTSKTGLTIHCNHLNQYLKKVQKKIQLDKHLTSHIFRHSHISILTELGTPLKAIMQRVGHSNPNTTLKIYSHVTERMRKELEDKLNDFKLEIL